MPVVDKVELPKKRPISKAVATMMSDEGGEAAKADEARKVRVDEPHRSIEGLAPMTTTSVKVEEMQKELTELLKEVSAPSTNI